MANIMVIDDDPQVRAMIGRVLSRVGHDVVLAVDGEEGLRKFEGCRPDLIIMDLLMPGMEGIETTMAIRRQAPTIPILAISGAPEFAQAYLAMAMGLGATASLLKPFRAAALEQAVTDLLADAQSGRPATLAAPEQPSDG